MRKQRVRRNNTSENHEKLHNSALQVYQLLLHLEYELRNTESHYRLALRFR